MFCDDPEGQDGGSGREVQEGGNIYIFTPLGLGASLVTQTVKNPLAMQET